MQEAFERFEDCTYIQRPDSQLLVQKVHGAGIKDSKEIFLAQKANVLCSELSLCLSSRSCRFRGWAIVLWA